MDELVSKIRYNLQGILNKIQMVCVSCGRDPDSIKCVVVTKTQPVDITEAAILAGAKYLGENYPEEAQEKILGLKKYDQVEWHMIGHLQSRKSRIVCEYFNCLQSLDSFRLAEKMDRLLEIQNKKIPVFLEFNVSGEGSKSGFPAWDESSWPLLIPDISRINTFPHLQVMGLMTMPPLFSEKDQVSPYFIRLRKLQGYLTDQIPGITLKELSMGTSSDFDIAIQEGATFIRIGQAILGSRQYP